MQFSPTCDGCCFRPTKQALVDPEATFVVALATALRRRQAVVRLLTREFGNEDRIFADNPTFFK